ncbi:uncharacterized protein [Misgurnus anguillicaudatus]|uniref:uncharacterized protein isoform X1 n=1 Tax=Misgurnus anguillicaudatus TaxID=75329 RepID=UPI003CCF1257
MKATTLLVISLYINGVFGDEVKSVSVIEGGSVTLYTDITETHREDLIEWRFGDQQDLIARINKEANAVSIYDDVLNGRFRHRLQLNDQTGDLTITNITTQHTGLYTLDIFSRETTKKTFNISVSLDGNDEDQSSGLSSGVVAGLCVFLLVLVFALAVAVFLYRRLSRTTGNNRADITINLEETGNGDVYCTHTLCVSDSVR